ncbi:MAG: hypothetical protein WCA48_16160 [Pseudomonas gingeri]
MTHPISTLGAIHTVISLIPVIAGAYSFIRYYKIDPKTRAGSLYLISLTLTVATSFGVSSTGGLNAGHAFGVIVLLAAYAGAWAPAVSFLGRARPYLSAFGLSFSFLLSFVPATNETLTRLPLSHPIADHPMAPVVLTALAVLLGLFIVGFAAQCRQIYSRNKVSVRT